MRRFALLILLPLLAVGQDWRFAHPNATFVGGMRPQAILGSPLMAAAVEDAVRRDPSFAALFTMGRGFLESISEIRFSMVDKGTPEPDILALVSGQMDEAVVRMVGKGKTKAKRIDDSTLLLGNGVSFAQAAARMAKASAIPPHLLVGPPSVLVGKDSLWENDFWLAGHIPESAVTAILTGQGMKVSGIGMGVRFRDNVRAELSVEMNTPAMAQKLIELASNAEAPPYKGLTQYSVRGTTAHFSLDMPQQLMLDAARGGFAAVSAVAPTQTASPEVPRRKTILIQGLSEGPREIPLK